MKKLTRRSLAPGALLLAALAGCSSGASFQTDGKIVDDRYVHPDGLFSVDVPALFAEGMAIRDDYAEQMGSVSFSDDLGQLIRVDLLIAETEEQRAFLRSMDERGDWRTPVEGMRDSTIGSLRAGGIEAILLDQEAVSVGEGRDALHFSLSMPGGSSMEAVSGLERRRLDAYRFCLAFREGQAIYMLSSQHSIGLFGDPAEEAPYDRIRETHREELVALANGMTFGGAR